MVIRRSAYANFVESAILSCSFGGHLEATEVSVTKTAIQTLTSQTFKIE